KIAMIGCGRISGVYKNAFKALKDEVELVFAVDKDIEKAKEFSEGFDSCKAVADYKEILGKGIDIVHITTPHHLHASMAIDFMKHNSHVLVEKPMATTVQDANAMIEISEKENVKLGVIFQTRYANGCQKLKEIIAGGKIGNILGARSYLSWHRPNSYYDGSDWKGRWDKEGGSTLINQAIHSLDRVLWLTGQDIEWIDGSIANRNTSIIETEDTAEALVGLKNGALYQLYACTAYPINAPIQIEIVGDKGRVGLVQDDAWVHIDGEERYEIDDQLDPLVNGPSYWGSAHQLQIKDFYKSVKEDSEVFLDGKEGKKALELVLGIYKSAKEGKRVYIPFN
ncbi:MAG: Gfo/Idh/MocA family oxidoreductase, partial [Clostridiales bacterium]|nr:Gfo/Idh/MocA family oxidoreductase [Clostridiales bacterium]